MDSYFSGRELTRPYTCGKNVTDFSLEELRAWPLELTEEERQSPFARYFDEPLAPLQPEMLPALEGPLAPEQCYMPDKALDVMLRGVGNYPGNGYGVLPNGVGYASAQIRQDGITDEMIRHYREDFAHEPRTLFYKLWYPRYHMAHFDDAIGEDYGLGMTIQTMNWELLDMEKHLGIRREDIPKVDPKCLAVMGLGGPAWQLSNPDTVHQTYMVQYVRETDAGRLLWIHYWWGLQVNPDGTVTVCPLFDQEKMLSLMRSMMLHAMTESCNEVKLIRAFWDETHPKA